MRCGARVVRRGGVDRGGIAVDASDEDGGADGDEVAGRELDFLDALAIDVGAVGRAEVLDEEAAVFDAELAVLTRDAGDGDADIAALAAADEEAGPLHGGVASVAFGIDGNKGDVHAGRILATGRVEGPLFRGRWAAAGGN